MQESFTIGDFAKMMLKHIKFIILITAVCAIAAFFITRYVITPMYSSSVTFYVHNDYSGKDITTQDITVTKSLAKNYEVILTSKRVLNEVIKETNLVLTYEQLKNMISFGAIDDSESYKLTVTCSNPDQAALIANTIYDVAPENIINILSATAVNVIDPAEPNYKKISPSTVKNLLIGIIIGMVLSMGISFIIELFNTNIKDSDDFKKHFSIPVLGDIPSSTVSKSKKGYYYYEQQ